MPISEEIESRILKSIHQNHPKGPVTQAKQKDCVRIANKSRLLREFYVIWRVLCVVVRDMQSEHGSRKNGINLVRNTLMRVKNTSICTRSRVLNGSKPAIA